jgi:WD40 repeat protein
MGLGLAAAQVSVPELLTLLAGRPLERIDLLGRAQAMFWSSARNLVYLTLVHQALHDHQQAVQAFLEADKPVERGGEPSQEKRTAVQCRKVLMAAVTVLLPVSLVIAGSASLADAVTDNPTSKILPAASPGTQVWARTFGHSGTSGGAVSVAASPNGKTAYVTGYITAASGTEEWGTIAYNTVTGSQVWSKAYIGPGAIDGIPNRAVSVVVSPNGKTVYVTGESGSAAYGDFTSYGTVAYSAATGAQLWAKRYGVAGDYASSPVEVAVSPNGKMVYVTGDSDNSYTAGGGTDYATVAYKAANGAQVWVRRFNGGLDYGGAASIAVNPNGSTVYVTGNTGTGTSTAFATIAYSAVTGAQRWIKHYSGGEYGDGGAAVAVSPNGKTVAITGSVYTRGTTEYATIAYNAVTGAQVWAKRNGTPGTARAVAVSPNGKAVLVSGVVGTAGVQEYATIAYNTATGARVWGRSYDGDEFGGNGDQAYAMAVSKNGKTVYVTGTTHAAGHATTIAYNAATGTPLWVRSHNGGGTVSVAVSPETGTVLVTGYANPSVYLTIAYQG